MSEANSIQVASQGAVLAGVEPRFLCEVAGLCDAMEMVVTLRETAESFEDVFKRAMNDALDAFVAKLNEMQLKIQAEEWTG